MSTAQVVWIAGLTAAICALLAFVAGCIITRMQLRHVGRQRYQEGYDTGERVGWYNAADELWQRFLRLRANFTSSSQRPDYLKGYEDASKHLNHYWDHVDRLT